MALGLHRSTFERFPFTTECTTSPIWKATNALPFPSIYVDPINEPVIPNNFLFHSSPPFITHFLFRFRRFLLLPVFQPITCLGSRILLFSSRKFSGSTISKLVFIFRIAFFHVG